MRRAVGRPVRSPGSCDDQHDARKQRTAAASQGGAAVITAPVLNVLYAWTHESRYCILYKPPRGGLPGHS